MDSAHPRSNASIFTLQPHSRGSNGAPRRLLGQQKQPICDGADVDMRMIDSHQLISAASMAKITIRNATMADVDAIVKIAVEVIPQEPQQHRYGIHLLAIQPLLLIFLQQTIPNNSIVEIVETLTGIGSNIMAELSTKSSGSISSPRTVPAFHEATFI